MLIDKLIVIILIILLVRRGNLRECMLPKKGKTFSYFEFWEQMKDR